MILKIIPFLSRGFQNSYLEPSMLRGIITLCFKGYSYLEPSIYVGNSYIEASILKDLESCIVKGIST